MLYKARKKLQKNVDNKELAQGEFKLGNSAVHLCADGRKRKIELPGDLLVGHAGLAAHPENKPAFFGKFRKSEIKLVLQVAQGQILLRRKIGGFRMIALLKHRDHSPFGHLANTGVVDRGAEISAECIFERQFRFSLPDINEYIVHHIFCILAGTEQTVRSYQSLFPVSVV